MNLWRFVPQISRPFNPAYRGVWDLMTPREKQASFLIDMIVVLIAGAAGWYFA